MLPDTDLAVEAAAGHPAAFEALVRRHQATVRGLTRRLTSRSPDADDIAQATFLKAWQQIGSYKGGSFKAWLCTIAYREFLHARRRAKPEVAFDDSVHVLCFEHDELRVGDHLDLYRALSSLPEAQRVCVSLCVAAGLTHREVADITQWPLGTVKSHVVRGVGALRKALATEHVA